MPMFVFAAMRMRLLHGLDNGLGLTPPMGYNTWNDLGCNSLNEENIKAVADSMASNGLLTAGFEYLNLDDCWMASMRDETGKLQGDLQRFPSGMKSLADYVHSKGLKFGIYSDRGSKTCQGLPATLGNETLDAQTFADWGVDYLKEDNCYSSTGPDDFNQLFKEFGLMRDALNATGRPIFFSVCGGGDHGPGDNITYYASDPRGGAKLANSWRISSDVIEWQTCQMAYLADNGLEEFAGVGGFNDPDMLFGSAASWQMTEARSRTQFNLWAVLMAPLIIGANVRTLSAYDLDTYTNAEVISVSQDRLARQGRRVANESDRASKTSSSVWARELADGKVAMVFVNNYDCAKTIVCHRSCWDQLPFKTGTQLDVRDVWSHQSAASRGAVAGEDYEVNVEVGDGASKMLIFRQLAAVLV